MGKRLAFEVLQYCKGNLRIYLEHVNILIIFINIIRYYNIAVKSYIAIFAVLFCCQTNNNNIVILMMVFVVSIEYAPSLLKTQLSSFRKGNNSSSSRSTGPRISFIGHSMGGLIIRHALQVGSY